MWQGLNGGAHFSLVLEGKIPFQKLLQLEDNCLLFSEENRKIEHWPHFASAHIILFLLLHSHDFMEGLPIILHPENIASTGQYGFIMDEFSVQPKFIGMKF